MQNAKWRVSFDADGDLWITDDEDRWVCVGQTELADMRSNDWMTEAAWTRKFGIGESC